MPFSPTSTLPSLSLLANILQVEKISKDVHALIDSEKAYRGETLQDLEGTEAEVKGLLEQLKSDLRSKLSDLAKETEHRSAGVDEAVGAAEKKFTAAMIETVSGRSDAASLGAADTVVFGTAAGGARSKGSGGAAAGHSYRREEGGSGGSER